MNRAGHFEKKFDVCVVGGAGHVGAPLAMVFAKKGLRTLIYDINANALEHLSRGEMPFFEEGGPQLLREVLDSKMLSFSSTISDLGHAATIILTIGTPIDEFHNPMLRVVTDCLDDLLPYLHDEQLIILRSTVFPGVTDHVHQYLRQRGKEAKVAFCPERVVQGYSIRELQTLPQIVSGATPESEAAAGRLFSTIAPSIVKMACKEAEFAKLMTNAYRYIQFATANQFYMLADACGLDYSRILAGLKENYPRCRDMPGPGFAGGPCLFKDTLQLAAFANGQFGLGYAAMQTNEGLPAYLLNRLKTRYPIKEMTVGLMGMAFKADSDDTRTSLSYKLKKLLKFSAKAVLTSDPFVKTDRELVPVERLIDESDVLILCVPHTPYKKLDLKRKPVLDLWNVYTDPAVRI